jgi:hypothetical protein
MSRYNEFKAWNRMPEGKAVVDAPDGTVEVFETGLSTSTLYDNTNHPLIQSGDWQVRHQRYGRGSAPTSRNKNGR